MGKIVPKFDLSIICKEILSPEETSKPKSPMEFFELHFTGDMLLKLLDKYSLQKKYHLNVKSDERYVFLGGLLLSGYAKYPNKRIYWFPQKFYKIA